MSQKMKIIIGIIMFVAIIAGASVAYKALSKRVENENGAGLEVEKSEEAAEKSEEDAEIPSAETSSAEAGDIGLAEEGATVEEEQDQLQKAPDFSLQDKDGNTIKLSEIIAEGKPIVLNFWASWCPPCKEEMPDFDMVYKELGEDVQFMMVNMTDGQRETVELGTKYIEEQGFSFPVFFDVNQEGAINYQIYSIPTTVFIDKDGYMVTGAQGMIDEAMLRKGIGMIVD